MVDRSDEVFHYSGEILTSMPARSMREGLFGKSLEDALQTFFENYPQLIPGKQIDPGNDDPPRFIGIKLRLPRFVLPIPELCAPCVDRNLPACPGGLHSVGIYPRYITGGLRSPTSG
jgi:hypothetical protein